ncbi:MFS transporter [Pseudomonadota bacterium]
MYPNINPKWDYLSFGKENWRLLAFGILLNFCASAGQTYFISVFGGEIRSEFSLSHGNFGLLYSLATVTSAVLLFWLGRIIDHIDLRIFSVCVSVGLAGASLLMSFSINIASLSLAFFALRLLGQGLMAHTAFTTTARYIDDKRGTAVSIIFLGLTAGLAFFPILGVWLSNNFGWRNTWLYLGLSYLIVLAPIVAWLLNDHHQRHKEFLSKLNRDTNQANQHNDQKNVHEVLRDYKFYLIVPAFMAPAFIFTGFLFHQVHLVETKGWSLTWFASGFTGLAIASFVTSLLLGPLIDRMKAVRLLPFFLLPFAIALSLLASSNHPWIAPISLLFMGINVGAFHTLFGAVWAEIYGVVHLGAIRAVAHVFQVIASALSPILFGELIDIGISIETIAIACIGYVFIASILTRLANHQPLAQSD